MKPQRPVQDQSTLFNSARTPDCDRVGRFRVSAGHAAALSCCVIIVAGVAWLMVQIHLMHTVQSTLSQHINAHDIAKNIDIQVLLCRRYEKDVFLNLKDFETYASYLEKWLQAWDKMNGLLDQIDENLVDSHVVAEIDVMKGNADNYKRLFLEITDLIVSGKIRDASQANQAITPFKSYARQIILDAEHLGEKFSVLIEQQTARLKQELAGSLFLTTFLAVVPAGLIIVGQLWFSRQIETAHRHLEKQNQILADKEAEMRKLAMVAAHTDNAVIITDADYRIEWINNSFTRITELRFDDVVGKTPDEVFRDTFADLATVKLVQEHLGKGRAFQVEAVGQTPSGRKYWLAVDAQPIRDELDRVSNYVAVQRDITHQKCAEKLLREAARTDQLTLLPNRAEIHERISQAIDRWHRDREHRFALLFLDFDRFKTINDSLGHDVGDLLLIEIANRLRVCLRVDGADLDPDPQQCASRLGGDEFVVLLEGIESIDEAHEVARTLLDRLSQPYHLAGNEVHTSASIGITFSDQEYQRADEVIRDADTAMYRAKATGKAHVVSFDFRMCEAVQARQRLEMDLHYAQAKGELMLAYQPIISLESGRLMGFESLLRWEHHQLGQIPAAQFFPIAEETGLMIPIGVWVMHQACEQLSRWQRQFPSLPSLSMSINLSYNQLLLPTLTSDILEATLSAQVDPANVYLEIAESDIIRDMGTSLRVLDKLSTAGVKLVLDDFGAEHLSLHCLQELPLDMLKINRAFVSNAESNAAYAAIIQAIITLTHNLGIDLIAMGVETAEQVAQLQALECHFGQGHLFAKPMLAENCGQYLDRSVSGTVFTSDLKKPA